MYIRILLLFLVSKVLSVPMFMNTTYCLNSNLFSMTNFQVGADYYAYVESTSTGSNNNLVYAPLNLTVKTQPFNFTGSVFPSIRTSTLTNSTSQSFLIYTSGQVQIHTNMTANLSKTLNFSMLPSYYVMDACFGNTNSEVFVLVTGITTSYYSFLIYNNSFNTAPTIVNTTISKNAVINKMICKYNRIYTLFTGLFVAYALNSSLTQLYYNPLSSYNNVYMDMHVPNNQIFLVLNGYYVYINNQTNWANLRTITFNAYLTSAIILDSYYFALTDSSSLCMFDYSAVVMLDCIAAKRTIAQKLRTLDSKILMVADFTMNVNTAIDFNNYTLSYINRNKPCATTYYYNSTLNQCVKNITAPSSNTTSPINNTILNTTNSSSSFVFSTPAAPVVNSSSPTFAAPVIAPTAPVVQNSEVQLAQYFDSIKQQYQSGMSKAASSAIMVSSIKFSPQFLLSLSLVFDDISYYIFHQKIYPSTVNFFLNKPEFFIADQDAMFIINTLDQVTNYAVANNIRNQQLLQIQTLKSQEIFFTRSFIENYRNAYYMTLIIFLGMMLLRGMFYLIKLRWSKFANVHQFIRRNSQWWVLFSSLVECNLSRSSFDFGIQIQMPSFDTPLDKINMFACVIFFCLIFVYVLTFYQLVYSTCNRKSAKIFLMPCKYRMMSFIFQPALVVVRSCLRSFCHAYFLSNYNKQIIILFLTDLLFICLSLKMRKLFHNFLVFTMYTLYLAFFATFDLFFILESQSLISPYTKRQLFGIITVGALIGTSFLVTIIFLFLFLQVHIRFGIKKWNNYKSQNSPNKAMMQMIENKLQNKQNQKTSTGIKMKFNKPDGKHRTIRIKKYETSRANQLKICRFSQKDTSPNHSRTSHRN